MAITIQQFDVYFKELHGYDPYSWQRRLAQRAVDGDWPSVIDLPTGAGKTACLDIGVFALACQASLPPEDRTAPRRLFFCVNRRIIVDEAYSRAKRIAQSLWQAERARGSDRPTLQRVAEALRRVAGTADDQRLREQVPPLDTLELRGGIYRDNRWARSATQPTIVCTTIDQLGSRLLFRGYGVTASAAPIQAALAAYDSLILLDEAHISRPFLQTLTRIRHYLDPERWAEEGLAIRPMMIVPMTATPPEGVDSRDIVRLSDEDRQNERLRRRLAASKPAWLKPPVTDVAKGAVQDVLRIVKERTESQIPTAIGVIVNRVTTARAVYNNLLAERDKAKKKTTIPPDTPVELVIGSMRPIDRDVQNETLQPLIGEDRPAVSQKTSIVIATQCLEVGADYDFDVLITECASLDALRQRFGRLNRAGRYDADDNPIRSEATILIKKTDAKDPDKLDDAKPADPIYGNAMAQTWHWLQSVARDNASPEDESPGGSESVTVGSEAMVDFGIDAFNRLLDQHGEDGRIPSLLLGPSATIDAPVILPAYLDLWCQTSPRPAADPDVSLFIHGPGQFDTDVQVCFRADLCDGDESNADQWCDIVALLPPSAAECVAIPISRIRSWLRPSDRGRKENVEAGDLLVSHAEKTKKDLEGDRHAQPVRNAVLWRGVKKSKRVESIGEIRSGDTLVLPVSCVSDHDIDDLFHLPRRGATSTEEPPAPASKANAPTEHIELDVAEIAFERARDRSAMRLHPLFRNRFPDSDAFAALLALATPDADGEAVRMGQWREALNRAADSIADGEHDELRDRLRRLANPKYGLRIELYPDGQGIVLTTRKRTESMTDWYLPPLDDGDDEWSLTHRECPILLKDHTRHVIDKLLAMVKEIPLSHWSDALIVAAKYHDWGKADERFQAMLRRTDRTDAWLLASRLSEVLAKSDGMPQTRAQRRQARRRAGLPDGFRHEMLSVQLAQTDAEMSATSPESEIILHLVAAHHGYARPFAPVVSDDELPPVEVCGVVLSHDQRASLAPPHRLDSGIADRFWCMTRRFGWWGLSYLETILRLADQQVSAEEDEGLGDRVPEHTTMETIA